MISYRRIAAKLKLLGSLKGVEDAFQVAYMYFREVDWSRVGVLIGEEPLKYANRLLDLALVEFMDKATFSKVEQLKERIEGLLKRGA